MIRGSLAWALVAGVVLTVSPTASAQMVEDPVYLAVPPKIVELSDVLAQARQAHASCDAITKRSSFRKLQSAMAGASRVMLREQAMIIRALGQMHAGGHRVPDIGEARTTDEVTIAVSQAISTSKKDDARDKLVEIWWRLQRYDALARFYHSLVGAIYEIAPTRL